MLLFVAGTVLYQISVGALGILLATFTGTMGQFGLLMIPVADRAESAVGQHDADGKHADRGCKT